MHSLALIGESIASAEPSFCIPSSKSISNRLLIIEYLAGKSLQISNLSSSEDTVLLRKALQKMRRLSIETKRLRLGMLTKADTVACTADRVELYCGNAGTTCRFLTALLSITPGKWLLNADKQMENRPLKPLIEALKQLGADVEPQSKSTIFPLKITGKPLRGGQTLSLPADLSSQFVSALLLVAPYLQRGLSLELSPSQVSRPYIDMTTALMKENGADVEIKDNILHISPQEYVFLSPAVEADWSAAAFAYALVAIRKIKGLKIKGLKAHSLQGDSVVADLFSEHFNVKTDYFANHVVISYCETISKQHKPLIINFKHYPDLFLPILMTAVCLNIPFEFQGLETLAYKESDRLGGAIAELKKVGVEISYGVDRIVRNDCKHATYADVAKTEIETYNDHRMAMAFALLASKYDNIRIKNPICVSKSFPTYWTELSKFFRIELL